MLTLERAGRTCYLSEGKSDGTLEGAEKFVRGIIKRGHESVLEHVGWTVRFICDRGVTHELVRHRIGVAFSQESTRYVDYAAGDEHGHCRFIIPPWCDLRPGEYCLSEDEDPEWITRPNDLAHWDEIRDRREGTLCWLTAMMDCESTYQSLRRMGWSPQQARDVLPNSTKTEIVVTANAREWRHIFKLRLAKAAHPQMREVMVLAARQLNERAPAVFEDALVAVLSANGEE